MSVPTGTLAQQHRAQLYSTFVKTIDELQGCTPADVLSALSDACSTRARMASNDRECEAWALTGSHLQLCSFNPDLQS